MTKSVKSTDGRFTLCQNLSTPAPTEDSRFVKNLSHPAPTEDSLFVKICQLHRLCLFTGHTN